MASIDDPKTDDRKYRAPALEKGLDVLELLAAARAPMSLAQISNSLGRSVSELFRMVQVLEFRGYVALAESGDGFVLTNKLFALGMTRAPAKDLVEAALPVMRRLTDQISQSCHLAVASADQMVVVARIEAPGDLGFSVRIGYRRALVSATSGMVLYAFQPAEIRADWKSRLSKGLKAADWADFEARAEAARTAGYVRSESHAVKGVVDLSAPVTAMSGVVAALTCPYVETATALGMDKSIAAIRTAAREISADLAGAGD